MVEKLLQLRNDIGLLWLKEMKVKQLAVLDIEFVFRNDKVSRLLGIAVALLMAVVSFFIAFSFAKLWLAIVICIALGVISYFVSQKIIESKLSKTGKDPSQKFLKWKRVEEYIAIENSCIDLLDVMEYKNWDELKAGYNHILESEYWEHVDTILHYFYSHRATNITDALTLLYVETNDNRVKKVEIGTMLKNGMAEEEFPYGIRITLNKHSSELISNITGGDDVLKLQYAHIRKDIDKKYAQRKAKENE